MCQTSLSIGKGMPWTLVCVDKGMWMLWIVDWYSPRVMEKRKVSKVQKCVSWYPSRTFFSGSVKIFPWWVAGKSNSQTSSKIGFRSFILVVSWSCCVVRDGRSCEQGDFKVHARSGSLGFYFCGYRCFSPLKKYTLCYFDYNIQELM